MFLQNSGLEQLCSSEATLHRSLYHRVHRVYSDCRLVLVHQIPCLRDKPKPSAVAHSMQHTLDVLLQGHEAPKLHPLDIASSHALGGAFLCRRPDYLEKEIITLNHFMCGCEDLSSNPLDIPIQSFPVKLLAIVGTALYMLS